MIKLHQLFFLRALIVIFASAFSGPVYAGITDYSAYRDKNVIKAGSSPLTFSAYDGSSAYESPSGDYEVMREVRVRLNWQRKRTDVATGGGGATFWTYRVHYKVYPYGSPGSYDTGSVYVSFRPDDGVSPYTSCYEHIKVHSIAAAKVTLEVTGVVAYTGTTLLTAVTNPHLSANLPEDIRLELMIHTEKYRDLYSNTTTETNVRFNAPGTGVNPVGSPYGLLTWDYVEGAEEYDVEWVYIDSRDDHSGYYPFSGDEDPFEYKEPTRISTSNQNYEVPLTYPSGVLYFRVRTSGRYIDAAPNFSHVQPGEWSYRPTAMASALSYTISTDFEEDKNWQYTIAFAEEGKRKQVMTYYDGSLRSRQAVVDVTSDQTVLVGETKYDYEGRPVVAILPAPVYSKSLGYRQNFTLDAASATLFTKANFDEGTSEQVGNASGAGYYYSAEGLAGDFAATSFQNYVPDAGGAVTTGTATDGGYPYVQALYKRDGTGRIDKQSGVGQEHYMGNAGGRETEYYYGSTNATELHRMFGTNVGIATHYKKTMVVDPNNQASVAYMDQEGRVVATALTGEPPENLLALDTYNPFMLRVSLNDNNIVDQTNHVSTNITRLLNSVEGSGCSNLYQFNYDVTGVIYHNEFTSTAFLLPETTPRTYEEVDVCADCKYHVNIKVYAPDGTLVPLTYNASVVTEIDEDIESPVGADCDYETYTPSLAPILFEANFCQLGEYTVVKVLSLDTSGIHDEMIAALEAADLGEDYLNGLIDEYQRQVDTTLCDITCAQHCYAQVHEENPEMDTEGGTFAGLVQACIEENCDAYVQEMADTFAVYQCEAILAGIKLQVSPGGVFYEESDPSGSSLSSPYFWERVRAAIAATTLEFHNADGTVMAIQPSLSIVKNASSFQNWWADDLAPYHREYCHYENCVSLQTSNAYDYEMATIETWSEAAAEGYLNPQGMASISFGTNWTEPGPWDAGTVYTSITGSANDPYTALPDASLNNDGTFGNIWSFSADAGNGVYDVNFPFTDENRWQLFRGLYLQIKTNYIRNQNIAGCPYYTDDYAIVRDPDGSVNDLIDNVTAQQQSWSEVLYNTENLCEGNVQLWMDSLSLCCGVNLDNFSQEELDEISDSLLAWCSRAAGPHNPLGVLTDEAVADGELDNVISLLTAFDPENPCFEYLNPLQCASEPSPYQEGCEEVEITIYSVTDCFKDLVFLLNDLVIEEYNQGAGPNCYETGGSAYMNACSLDDNNTLVIDEANNELDWGKSVIPCETNCNMGLRFYDITGTQIIIADIISLGTPTYQSFYTGAGSPSGTFRNIKIQLMTTYGPVMTYVFSNSVCNMSFTQSELVDTCFALLKEDEFNYAFNFDTLRNDCIEQLMAQAAWNAQHDYNEMVQEFMEQYLSNHYDSCFSRMHEDFFVDYMNHEHHYTLYYYDQADNLLRTVPPAGFVPVVATAFTNGVYDGSTEPAHFLKSEYTYNSLNEVLTAKSPDGGLTTFFYDLKGRIVASQNAKQAVPDIGGEVRYSYTVYDERSRIKEVGQTSVDGTTDLLTDAIAKDDDDFDTWLTGGAHAQVMATHYDEQDQTPPTGLMANFYANRQDNLRSRVSYVEFFEDAAATLTSSTHYSYDEHGNVKELVTDDPTLENLGVRYKHMAYYYDLISGNVNVASYQNGHPDQFWHRFEYDADNRLTIAETSSDSLRWEREAKYFYYLHGPLARTEIGHDKVQGLDYAYTLHGWIKGVNSNTIVASRDMGHDGALDGANITAGDLDNDERDEANINNYSSQDVFGYTLGYYNNDYRSVGTNTFDASAGAAAGPLTSTATDLYNGNISNWVMAFADDNEERVATIGKLYAYDQLNRIRTVDCYTDLNFANDDVVANNTFAGATVQTDYEETFKYDPNGNIMNAERTGDGNTEMDDFVYYYKKSTGGNYRWSYDAGDYSNHPEPDATNQLDYVDDDPLLSGNYGDDVDQQSAGNYTYDEIGNLIDDNQEEIEDIEWTIYGKIRRITRDAGSEKPDLEFRYDAMGNRICKIVKPKDATYPHVMLDQKEWTYTYYNRDASGNVMAVYKRDLNASGSDITDNMTLSEQHMYGASRTGLVRALNNDETQIITGGFTFTPGSINADNTFPISSITATTSASGQSSGYRWMTRKSYELSNHLGNVYSVVTDKKIGHASTEYTDEVAYYTADVISATDYFAFGAAMPMRTFQSDEYRYGFNGKGNDAETGTQDYGFRIYNPSLGRFLSLDPLTGSYPWYTPYQFAGNKPIWCVDLDGLEEAYTNTGVRVLGPGNTFGGDQLYSLEELTARGVTPNGVTFNFDQEVKYKAYKRRQEHMAARKHKSSDTSHSGIVFGSTTTTTTMQGDKTGVTVGQTAISATSITLGLGTETANAMNRGLVIRGSEGNIHLMPRDYRPSGIKVGGDGALGPVVEGGSAVGSKMDIAGKGLDIAVFSYDVYKVFNAGTDEEREEAIGTAYVDGSGTIVSWVFPPFGMLLTLGQLQELRGTEYWQWQHNLATIETNKLRERYTNLDLLYADPMFQYWDGILQESEKRLGIIHTQTDDQYKQN